MIKSSAKPLDRIPTWAKRAIPIGVSVLILFYYFHRQNWGLLWSAVTRANFMLAILAVLFPQLVFWFFEVLVVERHVRWFHGPFPFRTFFWVRGAIYLLFMVNPSLGIGGVLLYLWRKARITWSKLWGMVLFRYGLLLWGLCVLLVPTTIAMHYYGFYKHTRIGIWIWWCLMIFALYWLIEAWLYWHHNRRFGIGTLVVHDQGQEFWTAFRLATRKQWWLTWAMEIPPFLLFLTGIYFLSMAFEVRIPFLRFMVFSPLVVAIADLPIAFAGFGSTTLAFALFFKEYGSAEAIAALSLFLPFARATFRVLIGFVSLRSALLDINALLQRPSTETKETPVSHE
jgi:hypothetical protein